MSSSRKGGRKISDRLFIISHHEAKGKKSNFFLEQKKNTRRRLKKGSKSLCDFMMEGGFEPFDSKVTSF
jgi:hypothetical protein